MGLVCCKNEVEEQNPEQAERLRLKQERENKVMADLTAQIWQFNPRRLLDPWDLQHPCNLPQVQLQLEEKKGILGPEKKALLEERTKKAELIMDHLLKMGADFLRSRYPEEGMFIQHLHELFRVPRNVEFVSDKARRLYLEVAEREEFAIRHEFLRFSIPFLNRFAELGVTHKEFVLAINRHCPHVKRRRPFKWRKYICFCNIFGCHTQAYMERKKERDNPQPVVKAPV